MPVPNDSWETVGDYEVATVLLPEEGPYEIHSMAANSFFGIVQYGYSDHISAGDNSAGYGYMGGMKAEEAKRAEEERKRKEAEQALKESEEKYRTILESMEEGYYEVDFDGKFIDANPTALDRLGFTKDECRPWTFLEVADHYASGT